jgi:CheY-like chemotaxis protein
MSFASPSESLADFHDEARRFVEQTRTHAKDIEFLVAAAERDMRDTQAALLLARPWHVLRFRDVLRAQCRRRAEALEVARQLGVDAHAYHVAARRVLAHLTTTPRSGELQTAPHLRRNAVLVADDYGDVRDVLAQVLEDAGFVVGTAANGLEAVIAAHAMRPGVIVMDVSMPVLDGIEATRLIKASDATRDARVIAYTANANAAIDDCPTQGLFVGVLQKPAMPAVVVATVRDAAKR